MSATTNEPGAHPLPPDTDEDLLAQLGYKQELHRKLSGFSNFAVSFSIISQAATATATFPKTRISVPRTVSWNERSVVPADA